MEYIILAMAIAIGWLLISQLSLYMRLRRLETFGANVTRVLTDPDEWDEMVQGIYQRRIRDWERRHKEFERANP